MKIKPAVIILSCFLFMSVIVKAQMSAPPTTGTSQVGKKPSDGTPPAPVGDAASGYAPSPVTNVPGANTPTVGSATAAATAAGISPPPAVKGGAPAPIPVLAQPSAAPVRAEAKTPDTKDTKSDKVIVEDKIIRPGNGTSLIIQSEIQNKNEEARASLQDYLQFRDPFKSPEVQNTVQGNVGQLEKYIVTEYKLTGVMTGPSRMRAMILSPDGKAHFVSEGMKLGNRGGTIKRITTKSVVVRERSVNALGEEEFTTTQILMTPETNGLAGK